MQDVYVTGMGVITPIGCGIEPFWEALVAGVSGVGPVTRFDTQWLPVHIAAEIKDFSGNGFLTGPEIQTMSRIERVTMTTARMALKSAGFSSPLPSAQKAMGFFVGSTGGAVAELQSCCTPVGKTSGTKNPEHLHEKSRWEKVCFDWLPKTAQTLGIEGIQVFNTNACAAGAYAISMAADRIRLGHSELALCGGVEILYPWAYLGFCSLRSLAPDACRPFDQNRQGPVLGEAAAMLVLESGASLRRRQKQPCARLAGIGWSCDGYHLSKPDPQGLGISWSIERALQDAGLRPDQIDCYIAHGTGTQHNDQVEAQTVGKLFGSKKLPVTAPKSMLGHSLGAASAVEALIGVLALRTGKIPPTINHTQTDPACPVEVVKQARAARLKACMSHSAGFGGNNATLIWTQPEVK